MTSYSSISAPYGDFVSFGALALSKPNELKASLDSTQDSTSFVQLTSNLPLEGSRTRKKCSLRAQTFSKESVMSVLSTVRIGSSVLGFLR